MRNNIVFRQDGYLILSKEELNYDTLIEWFIRHLNDNVYIVESGRIIGLISCKEFENHLRDGRGMPPIKEDYPFVDISMASDRIKIYKAFRDDITLFRLPLMEDGRIVGEYYNSLSYKENTERYHIKNIIPELRAFSSEISNYLVEKKWNRIVAIIDENDEYTIEVLQQINRVKIVFCHDYSSARDRLKSDEGDVVLDLKYPDEYREYYTEKLGIKDKVFIIFEMMSEILTRSFVSYCNKYGIHLVAVYAVGKEDISFLGKKDESKMSSNKTINDVLADQEYLKKFYYDNSECLEYATDKSFGQLGGRVVRFNGLYNRLLDVKSKYINVVYGERKTCGSPDSYSNSIHFFGPCIVQGICVTDDYTIETYLQKKINDRMPNSYKVVNHGSATHTPYGSFCNDWLFAMDTEFDCGDIVVIMDAFTDQAFDILRENQIPIISDCHMFDGSENLFLNNTYHCNHIANSIYADLIFEKLFGDNMELFSKGCGLRRQHIKKYFSICDINLDFRDDAFLNNTELLEYRDKLKKQRVPDYKNKKIGAICTQANPFTRGHLALVEYASKKMDYVYVFVSQDSLSPIQFLERMDIVRDAVKELDNVIVLASGSIFSSYRTFPDYFSAAKNYPEFDIANVGAEVRIFAEVLCPALGIKYRILGEEPVDMYTRNLVECFKRELPKYGINVIIIPRVLSENDEEIISASRVRNKLENRDYEGLDKYITPYAVQLLQKYYEEFYE